jgi:hypothetical protein
MTGQFKLAIVGNKNFCVAVTALSHDPQTAQNCCESPWKQGLTATKTLRVMWSSDDLAQELGAQLGLGALLQRPLPQRGTP